MAKEKANEERLAKRKAEDAKKKLDAELFAGTIQVQKVPFGTGKPYLYLHL